MKHIGNAIDTALLLGKIKKKDFAKKVGMSAVNLSKVLKKASIDALLLEKIASTLSIPVSSFFEENNSIDSRELCKDKQNTEIMAKPSNDCVGIPLIPIDAMAGFASGTGESIMGYDCDYYVIPSIRNANFLIQIKGESMEPKYMSGDIVACKKLCLDTFFQWNKVYVLDTEQGALIKCIKKSEQKNCVKCVSVNEKFDPFDLSLDSIHSLAIVVGLIRVE